MNNLALGGFLTGLSRTALENSRYPVQPQDPSKPHDRQIECRGSLNCVFCWGSMHEKGATLQIVGASTSGSVQSGEVSDALESVEVGAEAV